MCYSDEKSREGCRERWLSLCVKPLEGRNAQIACVYEIINVKNGKRYVGSTVHLQRRLYQHFRDLQKGKHHSGRLQNDYDQHGLEAFSVGVLEYVDNPEDLFGREQYYLDSLKPEYNILTEAGVAPGNVYAQQSRSVRRGRGMVMTDPAGWPWLRRELVTCIRLSKRERLLMDLRYGERFSWNEIDALEISGLSAATGKRLLRRIAEKLRQKAARVAAREQALEREKMCLGIVGRSR